MSKQLFSAYTLGALTLSNRIVMAPMTRCRAINNIPNELMTEYYSQRASAGLIITEGTSPSANGLGYQHIPGIFNQEQVNGWKKVTTAVHQKGGKIFLQLMHTGRIGNNLNLPPDCLLVGASNLKANGKIPTKEGKLDFSEPIGLNTNQVHEVIQHYVQASTNAINAGFDGVELHAAHGYLIEQFLNPNVNNRTDEFGGSIENRSKFLLEIAKQVSHTIGPEKIGVRISPFNTYNDMAPYGEVESTYSFVSKELNTLKIAYLHVSRMAVIPDATLQNIKKNFTGTLILCGGINAELAEKMVSENTADLIGMGLPFLSNPDLIQRIKNHSPLTPTDPTTFYSIGSKGYTDWPESK